MSASSRTLLCLVGLLVTHHSSSGQGVDDLISTRIYSLDEINLNLSAHIVRLYHADDPDSLETVIETWHSMAGPIEPVQRIRTLWRFRNGEFGVPELNQWYLANLIAYRHGVGVLGALFEEPKDILGRVIPEQLLRERYLLDHRFGAVTSEIAAALQVDAARHREAALIALVYQDRYPEFLAQLRSDQMVGTPLRELYDDLYRSVRDRKEDFYIAISAGMYSSSGELSKVGTLPEISLLGSEIHRRYQFDVEVTIRPTDAAEELEFQDAGELRRTKQHTGLHTGISVGRHVRRTDRGTSTLFVGVGVNMMNLFYGDNLPDDRSEFYGPDVSGSFNHRFRLGRASSKSINLRVRYAHVWYSNDHDSSFSGGELSILLGFGGSRSQKYVALGLME